MAVRALNVDRGDVAKGAVVEFCLIVGPGILVPAVTNGDSLTTSNLWVVALAVILLAPFVAGFIAARHHREAPLLHGAVAAAVGYAGVVIVNLCKRAIDGKSFSASLIVAILLFACIAVTLGMTGAYVTFRRELREGRDGRDGRDGREDAAS